MAKTSSVVKFLKNKNLKYDFTIVVQFVEEREDICEDLDYVEFVLEKKHYREIFPELKKFHYE